MTEIKFCKCIFCGKPATKLCDGPVGKSQYIGHPPKNFMAKVKDFRIAFAKVLMEETITCNACMCDDCAIKIAEGIDFCPRCVKRINIKAALKRQK